MSSWVAKSVAVGFDAVRGCELGDAVACRYAP